MGFTTSIEWKKLVVPAWEEKEHVSYDQVTHSTVKAIMKVPASAINVITGGVGGAIGGLINGIGGALGHNPQIDLPKLVEIELDVENKEHVEYDKIIKHSEKTELRANLTTAPHSELSPEGKPKAGKVYQFYCAAPFNGYMAPGSLAPLPDGERLAWAELRFGGGATPLKLEARPISGPEILRMLDDTHAARWFDPAKLERGSFYVVEYDLPFDLAHVYPIPDPDKRAEHVALLERELHALTMSVTEDHRVIEAAAAGGMSAHPFEVSAREHLQQARRVGARLDLLRDGRTLDSVLRGERARKSG